MPTIISTNHSIVMQPSFSTNTPTNATIKLAPSIVSATVISFEKQSDQKIWYKIRVEPLTSKKYFILRRYEDFTQFSQKLYDRFNDRAGTRLPPKIKNRIQLLPLNKQVYTQRLQELNQFLNILFQKQSIITDSFIVLEFFQTQDLFLSTEEDFIDTSYTQATSSRWKRLRCTSFLANRTSPPSTTTSSSSSLGLSSLCSQAANKIIPSWHRNNTTAPQPSVSTPAISKSSNTIMTGSTQINNSNNKQVLKKSKSSLGIYNTLELNPQHPLDNSTTIITSKNQLLHQDYHKIKSTIKIKVIYDVDNIIVIQVPRTISLFDLRSRISQKFSDPNMGAIQVKKDLVLLFNDNASSCCSLASTPLKNDTILPAILINKEQDLVQIMHTKWNRLEKVTLRCIM